MAYESAIGCPDGKLESGVQREHCEGIVVCGVFRWLRTAIVMPTVGDCLIRFEVRHMESAGYVAWNPRLGGKIPHQPMRHGAKQWVAFIAEHDRQ